MVWSANSISSPLQRLAQKQSSGNFTFGASPAATAQTLTGLQQPPSVVSSGGPTLSTAGLNAETAAGVSDKPASQQLKEKVLGPDNSPRDPKLASRSPSTAPQAFNLIQASTFKSPYAPEFLTQAVQGLNETDSYTAMMHQNWRESLLNSLSGENAAAVAPALAAASVAPGAKFSWAGGGGIGGGGAPAPRQPSYWEQKLALKDLGQAQKDIALASSKNVTGPFWSIANGRAQRTSTADAQKRSELAAQVLGLTSPAGRYTNLGWGTPAIKSPSFAPMLY